MTENKFIGKTIIFHGIECLVSSKLDNYHYRLVAMGGTKEKLEKDESFSEYHEWGAVAFPIVCPCCKEESWIDDSKIPNGIKYEIQCKKCKTLIMLSKHK